MCVSTVIGYSGHWRLWYCSISIITSCIWAGSILSYLREASFTWPKEFSYVRTFETDVSPIILLGINKGLSKWNSTGHTHEIDRKEQLYDFYPDSRVSAEIIYASHLVTFWLYLADAPLLMGQLQITYTVRSVGDFEYPVFQLTKSLTIRSMFLEALQRFQHPLNGTSKNTCAAVLIAFLL